MRKYSVSILLLLIVLQLKAVGTLSDSTVYSMILATESGRNIK